MLTNNDLQAIKAIVKEEVGTVKKQLNTLEIKVELVNKKIEQTQRETIDTLSALIHTGYNLHEERIKRIEKGLQASPIQ